MANNNQLKVRKQPERRCLGCMQSFPKKDLIRVVRTPDGSVELDFQGKKSGRGAYICPQEACLKRAVKSKALERAFATAIPEEVYENLYRQIGDADGKES